MATPDEIKIRIIAKDEASKVFRKASGASDSFRNSVTKLKVALAGITVAGGLFFKSVIETGASVQALRVRLRYLTGSVEGGAKAFQAMSNYASNVPFALEEIQQGSAQLLTVSKDVDELNGLLSITGDIAAVSGLSFVEASSQLQRAFSGGIASADMFRERGVAAFLGFEQGVSYSADETRNKIISMFQDGTTSAKGATAELANTFQGQVSMMQDAWFSLKLALADAGLVDEATKQIKNLTDLLKDPETINGVKKFTSALLNLFQFVTRNAQVLMAVGAVWIGGRAGAGVGGMLGKRGQLIGGALGGITALLAAMSLLDEETKKTMTDMTVYTEAAATPISDSLAKMTTSITKTKVELSDLDKKLKLTMITMVDVEKNAVDSLENSLVDLSMGTKTAKEAFSDMAKSIIADLTRMSIRESITKPLYGLISKGGSGLFGAALTSFTGLGGATSATEGSFAGGGFTGNGARSGGVDGKGGFNAILHPNETVIDHTKGQGSGGAVNVTLNITTGVAQTVRAELSNLMPAITEATKAGVLEARQRGGSYSRALAGI